MVNLKESGIRGLRMWLIPFTTLVVAVAAVWQSGKDETAALQGVWQAKSATMAGKAVPSEIVQQLRLEIRGRGYLVMTSAGPDEGHLEIDDQANPKRMKIIGQRGPNKDRTVLAVYEVQGNRLRISYLMRGTDYPTDFTSTTENKHFVVEYERKP
jgi:uncharacterized protein (TIGR03067 family)